jgi:hypothetical protein
MVQGRPSQRGHQAAPQERRGQLQCRVFEFPLDESFAPVLIQHIMEMTPNILDGKLQRHATFVWQRIMRQFPLYTCPHFDLGHVAIGMLEDAEALRGNIEAVFYYLEQRCITTAKGLLPHGIIHVRP